MSDSYYNDYDLEFNNHKTKRNNKDEWSKEDYEKYSSILQKAQCDYKKIFGYQAHDKVEDKILFVKYNKESELFIIYDPNDLKILVSIKKNWRQFEGDKYGDDRYEYWDEIPPER